jgi:hypothetical protein
MRDRFRGKDRQENEPRRRPPWSRQPSPLTPARCRRPLWARGLSSPIPSPRYQSGLVPPALSPASSPVVALSDAVTFADRSPPVGRHASASPASSECWIGDPSMQRMVPTLFIALCWRLQLRRRLALVARSSSRRLQCPSFHQFGHRALLPAGPRHRSSKNWCWWF